MKRSLSVLALVAFVGAFAARANAVDYLIPGKLFIAKVDGKLVKVLSKGTFTLPATPPTVGGATLRVFDTAAVPTGGDDTYSLPAPGWTALGNPPGAKGYKYKGAGTAADPCKVVLIKANLIKAVCKDKGAGGVLQTPPYAGTGGAILAVGGDNYCAEFGGTEIKNDAKLVKRKDATPPAMCPGAGPCLPPAVSDCPIQPGRYTITQVAGGTLSVYTFAPFPFPAGGTIVQDVDTSSVAGGCVHSTVVPFPGGFDAPIFCVPALGLTVDVAQTGCGIGRIDSNGGSDFTINELGDTSDSSATCSLPQAGCAFGLDASIRVDVTVGGGGPDTCDGSGIADAIVSVPVHTTSWSEATIAGACVAGFCTAGNVGAPCATDPICTCGTGAQDTEAVVAEFDQILDFTTDTASAMFSDIDGDGCSASGPIPGGPFTGKGECITGAPGTVVTVAAGTFGSTGGTFDGAFFTDLPNTVSAAAAFGCAACPSAPLINYSGLATRCIP